MYMCSSKSMYNVYVMRNRGLYVTKTSLRLYTCIKYMYIVHMHFRTSIHEQVNYMYDS